MIFNRASIHNQPEHSSVLSVAFSASTACELVDAFHTIVHNGCALLAVRHCVVALPAADHLSWLLFSSQQSVAEGLLHLPYPSSLTIEECVWRDGKLMVVQDRGENGQIGSLWPAKDSQKELAVEDGAGALCCVPLMVAAQCIGTLTLYAAEPYAFTSQRVQHCALFAEQAALILHSLQRAKEAEAIAVQQERSQAQFVSMIAHELRSPLNSINGYLELALDGVGGALNAEQREFVRRARAGSEQLYALLEDLLMISRVDAGHLKLNREIISLEDVIANSVEELELSTEDQKVAVSVDILERLPRLYADAVRLQQVLRNLINNALHFTPAGGWISIRATTEIAGHVMSSERGEHGSEEEVQRVICLQVKDNGCGIAPAYHQRIFERFFQVPGASGGRASGQGLGLAIVKMIVELHGGTVEVESVPGNGSTFTCRLPCLMS